MENCGDINKLLKGGDERPHGMWWVVSFSPPKCEFFTSQTRTERASIGGPYGTPIDQLTCEGLAEGPLVRTSICACVKMVARTGMRMVVFRKMSGHGAGVGGTEPVPSSLMILG